MGTGKLENKIKDFVRKQGIKLVGIAGPERLDGPPSLDPTYTLPGACSVVCFALPMDVRAIYDFLSKRNYAPHALDQVKMNQRIFRVAEATAGYLNSLGYPSRAVPTNNTYRRSPDMFATHPSFSHRFGAIAAGIAAQGWSGNVMTGEHGAAVYLSTVVTRARLESDPPLDPRHFLDSVCCKCKLCEKSCASGMFEDREEEYVLLGGKLHPRGKRRNIDFCNTTCFGLHALSRDRKWTSFSTHWIDSWVEKLPSGKNKLRVRYDLLRKGSSTGDSTPRYDLIRRLGSTLYPYDLIDEYIESHPERLPEKSRFADRLIPFARKLGVTNAEDLSDERILTCGHCALICGPNLAETKKRYEILLSGGLVVPGPTGEVTTAMNFADAVKIREANRPRVPWTRQFRDMLASTWLWMRFYFGFELFRSIIPGFLYARKLKQAVRDQAGAGNNPAKA